MASLRVTWRNDRFIFCQTKLLSADRQEFQLLLVLKLEVMKFFPSKEGTEGWVK
jgi:hypothetical protein